MPGSCSRHAGRGRRRSAARGIAAGALIASVAAGLWFGVRPWPGTPAPATQSASARAAAGAAQAPRAAGSVFRDALADGSRGPEMVVVPAGRFTMGVAHGLDRERPAHRVRIGAAFAIARYEITFDEYDRYCDADRRCDRPGDEGWGRGARPVVNVSWADARRYADWLSAQSGQRYRLPTEAQWEYAARAGTRTAYWWGDGIGAGNANCDGCGSRWDDRSTSPVDAFEANPWGLHGVAGNVLEWTEDCWHDSYRGAPADGRAWRAEDDGRCFGRVLRGGSWLDFPMWLRSGNRDWDGRASRSPAIGFRLVRELAGERPADRSGSGG